MSIKKLSPSLPSSFPTCLGPLGQILLLQSKDVCDCVKVNGKEEQRISVQNQRCLYNHKPQSALPQAPLALFSKTTDKTNLKLKSMMISASDFKRTTALCAFRLLLLFMCHNFIVLRSRGANVILQNEIVEM